MFSSELLELYEEVSERNLKVAVVSCFVVSRQICDEGRDVLPTNYAKIQYDIQLEQKRGMRYSL